MEIAGFYLSEKMARKALEWIQRANDGGFTDSETLRSLVPHCVTRIGPIGNRKDLEQTIGSPDVQQGYEKSMLDLTTTWSLGDIDGFLVGLEGTMKALGLKTALTLDSLTQLSRILYDVAERLCLKECWKAAESALSLALVMAPGAFPAERFNSILPSQPRS
jgi:hypothetical protein